MPQPEFDYQKTRASISLHYGIELDDTSITILSVLSAAQKKHFTEQQKILESAAEKISISTKSLEPHHQKPGWQAFWFGMGKFGLALIFATSVLTGVYFYNEANKQEQDKLPAELQWYKGYYQAIQTRNKKAIIDFLKNNPMPGEH
jgi:hypothetical protein